MRASVFILLLSLTLQLQAQQLPTIEEKTKSLPRSGGFFNFYWDEAADRIWLEIDKLNAEVLYNISLPAAIGSNDIGLDRGLLGDAHVVAFSHVGRRLLMTEPNFRYRAVTTDKAEKRAVEQSFAQSILWGFPIEAESGGHVLVDATEFLLRDAMKVSNRLRSSGQGSYSIDRSRCAMYLERTKNFPMNTEFESTITFVNTDGVTGNHINSVAPAPEAVTVRMHHSFVQLPDSNYKPRILDPRSGFIDISYFDYSTPVAEPIGKYLAIRHRLQKKDPSAAKSEPVKPIIYYLDNGTPEPIRSALLEGARWWNQAFEAAGYINAFQVKVLPEDADPMDVRYNTINWVHRATRGWSYGAAVVDPRTGEIIKGNVTLGSLRVRQDYLIAQGLLAPFENGLPADDKMLKMALNRLKQLAAHEVGHTLGLQHNYAASASGRASVMDYPHPVVKLDDAGTIDLSDAYTGEIGAWDKAAIAWGYQDFPEGVDEKTALDRIITDANKKDLLFISDRDARSQGGMHPTAHLWDNGKNAVEELATVMKIRSAALAHFGENNIRPGVPMAFLEDVLVPVYLYHRYQVEAATKLVGGLYYTYATRGDGLVITKPLSKHDQLTALHAVIATIDPSALLLPERILRLIPPRPATYEYTRELFRKRSGLVLDALSPAEAAADLPLSFLFNSERLNRMTAYATEGLGVGEMIETLLTATWKSPRRKGMEGLIELQTEQLLLTYLLAAVVDDDNSFPVRAIITEKIASLNNYIQGRKKVTTDPVYNGHLLLALERMKSPASAKPVVHAPVPPGSPIGCDWP